MSAREGTDTEAGAEDKEKCDVSVHDVTIQVVGSLACGSFLGRKNFATGERAVRPQDQCQINYTVPCDNLKVQI